MTAAQQLHAMDGGVEATATRRGMGEIREGCRLRLEFEVAIRMQAKLCMSLTSLDQAVRLLELLD